MRVVLLALGIGLAGCSAQSKGPLFSDTTALPLSAGLNADITLEMPDGDRIPTHLSGLEDGKTLLLAMQHKNSEETDEDLALTFHPLPGRDEMLILQGRIEVLGVPKDDKYAYHIVSCPVGGTLGVYKFDLNSVEALGPFQGVDFTGLYAPEVRSRDGLVAFYEAAMTSETFEAVSFGPTLSCDMLFEG